MDDIEAFARSNRRARTVKVAMILAIALSPFGYVVWRFYKAHAVIAEHEREAREAEMLSDAETAQLRTSLAGAIKTLQSAKASFVADVTPAALDAVTPGESRCPYEASSTMRGVVAPGQNIEPIGLDTWRITQVQDDLDKGEATKTELGQIEGMRSLPGEVVFVVGKSSPPIVTGDSYLPGQITGTAYMYSYRQRRIVCAAPIEVENKEAIDIQYTYMEGNILDEDMKKRESAKSVLDADLDEQLNRQISERLRATN